LDTVDFDLPESKDNYKEYEDSKDERKFRVGKGLMNFKWKYAVFK
jgi:hypothetical protein